MLGLRAMMYIALSCVSSVVLGSVLSSNNKVGDFFDDVRYKAGELESSETDRRITD